MGGEIMIIYDNGIYREATIEDYIKFKDNTNISISELQRNKIEEFSMICEQKIEEGVDIVINGKTEHFSYKKDEDQKNIKDAFDLAVATQLSVPLHSDGGNCTLYSVEDMIRIYISEQTNLTHHKTYFNQMKQYIMTLSTEEDINSLTYGDPLTGNYLETYQTIMAQAQLLINTVLSNNT